MDDTSASTAGRRVLSLPRTESYLHSGCDPASGAWYGHGSSGTACAPRHASTQFTASLAHTHSSCPVSPLSRSFLAAMSRLQLTLDDEPSAGVDTAAVLWDGEDEVQFDMRQPSSPKHNKRKQPTSDSSAAFLDGLLAPVAPSMPPPVSVAARRSHTAATFERVQDRLAMKKFQARQAAEAEQSEEDVSEEESEVEAEEEAELSEAESESEAQAAADAEGEEGDARKSRVETRRAGSSSSSSSTRSRAGVEVVEWQGSPSELRRTADFSQLRLSKPLMRAVAELGYTRPTAVQSAVIPYAVAGRDILANAQTGSGKTAAFMLPILERLFVRSNKRSAVTRVLVLLPTRELASQCAAMTEQLGKYADIRCALVVGGLSMAAQEQALKQRPDVILATPGRLIDHMRNTASVHLDELEVLVLDEADRLLELGFVDELREIVRQCPRQRQTLLFSATLNASIGDLVLLSLNQPVRVTVDPLDSVVERLTQEFVRIKQKSSAEAEMREREAVVLALCQRSFKQRVLVFCQSKEECHRLLLLFSFFQLRAAELQGNLTQAQRMEALEQFRSGAVHFLICTDLASRGLDIAGVSCVINTSMPAQLRLYIHRVGRTARAGHSGRAVTLVGFHERKSVKALMKRTTEAAHARVLPTEVIARYRQRIESLADDLAAVLEQERMDKVERVAEMEVNRARNTLLHEADIKARPARSWFQTQQEKLNSKAAAVHSFVPEGSSGGAAHEGEERAEAEEEPVDGRRRGKGAAGAAKDPLRGLSRAQKRRKLMQQEAEREASQRLKAARAEDPTVSADDVRYLDPIAQAKLAGKAAKRRTLKAAQADGDAAAAHKTSRRASQKPTNGKRKREEEESSGVPKRKAVRHMEAEAVDRRFTKQIRKTKGKADEEATKKRKPDKAKKAFKSKGKHKRR